MGSRILERISFDMVVGALRAAAVKLDEKKKELDRLDSPIGNGDHGRTVSGAFKEIEPLLKSRDVDIGGLLKKVGRTFALSVGGATGPLYGTGFMEAGKAVEGKSEIGLEEIVEAARAFQEGIRRRGQAEVCDKTMLDTVHYAVVSLESALSENLSPNEALLRTKEAAKKGMESTKDLISLRGRSSRLGERSKGHIDPGAASCCYIIEAIVDFLTA